MRGRLGVGLVSRLDYWALPVEGIATRQCGLIHQHMHRSGEYRVARAHHQCRFF